MAPGIPKLTLSIEKLLEWLVCEQGGEPILQQLSDPYSSTFDNFAYVLPIPYIGCPG